MTSEPAGPSEEPSEPGACPLPDSWTSPQPEHWGRPTGTPYQSRLMDAVAGSEHHDSLEFGVPTRRHGEALKISYDQAMEFLWPSDGDY